MSPVRNIGLDLAFFSPVWKAVTYDFVLLFLPFFSSFCFFFGGGRVGRHQLGEYYLNIIT